MMIAIYMYIPWSRLIEVRPGIQWIQVLGRAEMTSKCAQNSCYEPKRIPLRRTAVACMALNDGMLVMLGARAKSI